MDRREFLRNGTRALVLSGIAVLSGTLLYRRYNYEEDCSFNFLCQDCRSLQSCSLPQGLSYRKELEGKRSGFEENSSDR